MTARPVAQSHSTELMYVMKMSTCNSRQLLNLVDIGLPLLPHGGHVGSDAGQLLPATNLQTKRKIGNRMESWHTKWKVGTQSGRLAHKVENWQHNGTLGITHPTHLLLRGSYAALSRGLNEALGQLKHKAKGEDMLGEDLCTVAF